MTIIETNLYHALENYPTKHLHLLTHKESNNGSTMADLIQAFNEVGKMKVRTFLAEEEEKILAWCWLVDDERYIEGEGFKKVFSFMTYVDPAHRRKGIGTELYKKATNYAKSYNKSLCVFVWDSRSSAFYEKNNAPIRQRHF